MSNQPIGVNTQPVGVLSDVGLSVRFNDWFERQKARGLKDIKFAVNSGSSDRHTARGAVEEILRAEQHFEAGIIEPHLDRV